MLLLFSEPTAFARWGQLSQVKYKINLKASRKFRELLNIKYLFGKERVKWQNFELSAILQPIQAVFFLFYANESLSNQQADSCDVTEAKL